MTTSIQPKTSKKELAGTLLLILFASSPILLLGGWILFPFVGCVYGIGCGFYYITDKTCKASSRLWKAVYPRIP